MELDDLVALLDLEPHPEGGFYTETFRSGLGVDGPSGPRSGSTAIYFALPGGGFSAWHRVTADEVWHHYAGSPVVLHVLHEDGRHVRHRLGRDLRAGERPQAVVPAHAWQATEADAGWALCGCTVAPGFTFDDFELPGRETLLDVFPQHEALIARLTR